MDNYTRRKFLTLQKRLYNLARDVSDFSDNLYPADFDRWGGRLQEITDNATKGYFVVSDILGGVPYVPGNE